MLLQTRTSKLQEISTILFGHADGAKDLEGRLQPVFKDQSEAIFSFTDEQISTFLSQNYRKHCEPLFDSCPDDLDLFLEALETSDFTTFTKVVIKL
jgi:hypothetical protein